MDIFKVAGMFLQFIGTLLLLLTIATVTFAFQFGRGPTWTDGFSVIVAIGMVWLGRTVEHWKQR